MAQSVKNLPVIKDTQVSTLGYEDPLEKRMITHSSILAWRIPWREEPTMDRGAWWVKSMGSQGSDMT